MQDVDKTGLLLELPKFRKSSKVSQDDESNESVSSGFRSGPDSESAHSGKLKNLDFPSNPKLVKSQCWN